MTNKGRVIAVTFSDPADKTPAYIHQFAEIKGVSDTEAARMILNHYFKLSCKARDALERKVKWELHRNRGYRTLAPFVPNLPKPKAKTHVLPSAAPSNPCETGKSSQQSLDL